MQIKPITEVRNVGVTITLDAADVADLRVLIRMAMAAMPRGRQGPSRPAYVAPLRPEVTGHTLLHELASHGL
ncbi:MAG: hypothetical protein V3V96_06630 [Acidiferrobacterales bacterium]